MFFPVFTNSRTWTLQQTTYALQDRTMGNSKIGPSIGTLQMVNKNIMILLPCLQGKYHHEHFQVDIYIKSVFNRFYLNAPCDWSIKHATPCQPIQCKVEKKWRLNQSRFRALFFFQFLEILYFRFHCTKMGLTHKITKHDNTCKLRVNFNHSFIYDKTFYLLLETGTYAVWTAAPSMVRMSLKLTSRALIGKLIYLCMFFLFFVFCFLFSIQISACFFFK